MENFLDEGNFIHTSYPFVHSSFSPIPAIHSFRLLLTISIRFLFISFFILIHFSVPIFIGDRDQESYEAFHQSRYLHKLYLSLSLSLSLFLSLSLSLSL